MTRRHGCVAPETDAPGRDTALEAEDDDEADDEGAALAAAASAGVPTCSRPHCGISIRTGIACRSF